MSKEIKKSELENLVKNMMLEEVKRRNIKSRLDEVNAKLKEGFGEDEEDDTCGNCNGSGEGSYDGSVCSSCGGSGVEASDSDDGFDEPEEDDREYDEEGNVY